MASSLPTTAITLPLSAPSKPHKNQLFRLLAPFPRQGGPPGRSVSAAGTRRRRYKGTAMREEKLSEMIEKKVAEALEACGDGGGGRGSEGCRVAWDEVEEVSRAKADLKRRIAESGADPLHHFCQENPDDDECTIYYED